MLSVCCLYHLHHKYHSWCWVRSVYWWLLQATTVIKTCEPVWSVRECRTPRDWSILALQNTRTGKAHYLVICKCPQAAKLGENITTSSICFPRRYLFCQYPQTSDKEELTLQSVICSHLFYADWGYLGSFYLVKLLLLCVFVCVFRKYS